MLLGEKLEGGRDLRNEFLLLIVLGDRRLSSDKDFICFLK